MTPEGKVKTQVKKILSQYDVYHFSPATGGYGRSGVPDIICCYEGQFIAIECKAGKGKLTLLQQRELNNIKKNGGITFLINEDNVDLIKTVFEPDVDGGC